jgi:hypothetical protein
MGPSGDGRQVPNGSALRVEYHYRRDARASNTRDSRSSDRCKAVGDRMDDGPLAVLERAELAARERRLAAVSEAERIRAAADEVAARIDADVPGRIASAVEALRLRHDTRATVEIAEIEQELAALAGDEPGARGDGEDADAGLSAAASLIVAAVLAETAEA